MAETAGGWAAVNGWLDGLGGAVDRVGGIVDTSADMAEDVARGRGAIHEEQDAKQARELDMALRLSAFQRGDTRTYPWALMVGAVGVIGLILALN